MSHALVFGGSGAIGQAIAAALEARGFDVTRTSRLGGAGGVLRIDPVGDPSTLTTLDALPPLDAVVWAQGANVNDAPGSLDVDTYRALMDANVTFIVATLDHLVRGARLASPSRLVVVSSIWETLARTGKFSYTISKAAVGGLVRAASADLAAAGHLVNAVLPSVTDTPMTRAMLAGEQIERVAGATGFDRLTSLDDVAETAAWLCSPSNTGVTGQSIQVDLGFSHVRQL
jgi:NAD(P)-dependent dehydrogenase (short-subunit alcohol dehydrogenase family)